MKYPKGVIAASVVMWLFVMCVGIACMVVAYNFNQGLYHCEYPSLVKFFIWSTVCLFCLLAVCFFFLCESSPCIFCTGIFLTVVLCLLLFILGAWGIHVYSQLEHPGPTYDACSMRVWRTGIAAIFADMIILAFSVVMGCCLACCSGRGDYASVEDSSINSEATDRKKNPWF